MSITALNHIHWTTSNGIYNFHFHPFFFLNMAYHGDIPASCLKKFRFSVFRNLERKSSVEIEDGADRIKIEMTPLTQLGTALGSL